VHPPIVPDLHQGRLPGTASFLSEKDQMDGGKY